MAEADARNLSDAHTEQPSLMGRKPSPDLVAKRNEDVHKRAWKRELAAAKGRRGAGRPSRPPEPR